MHEIDRSVLRLLQLMVFLLCVMTACGSLIGLAIVGQNYYLQQQIIQRTMVVSVDNSLEENSEKIDQLLERDE